MTKTRGPFGAPGYVEEIWCIICMVSGPHEKMRQNWKNTPPYQKKNYNTSFSFTVLSRYKSILEHNVAIACLTLHKVQVYDKYNGLIMQYVTYKHARFCKKYLWYTHCGSQAMLHFLVGKKLAALNLMFHWRSYCHCLIYHHELSKNP